MVGMRMTNTPWTRLRVALAVGAVTTLAACGSGAQPGTVPETATGSEVASQAVGPQYDSTHVYVAPGQLATFVDSWLATFGGRATDVAVTVVTPTPSETRSQLVLSPVGTLSVFDFTKPVPYPFGAERTGWLMADFDAGVALARDSGADVQVAPFTDPIGRDAIVQFPGGINAQLYWHTTPPSYDPLESVPDNRIYLSPDAIDEFLDSYLHFTGGTVVADDAEVDGALIGSPGTAFRRILVDSGFGHTWIAVTDGHVAYPFGREVTGYAVENLPATIDRAEANGATVLAAPVAVGGADTAVLQFPGGYIAEFHTVRKN